MDIAIIGAGQVGRALQVAEIVILASPYVDAGEEVVADIKDLVAGKTVVDATNPLTPDYSGLATNGISAAEEFQRRLPNASVVKAFNTIFASRQAAPSAAIDGFVAGDAAAGKQQVLALVASMGFNPVDVGPLTAARYLEGMAFLNIRLNAANGWDWTSTWKLEH